MSIKLTKFENGIGFYVRPFWLLLITAINVVVFSCVPEKETLKRFEWTDFIETKSVKAEYLNFEGPINPSSFQILRDSIVLSIDKRASEGHYVYFHNLTGELITIAGRKGSGPGELLSCKIQISQDEKKLYVFDYLTQQYTIWNTDSVLRQGLNYHPDVIKLDPDIEEVFFIDESSILVYNSMYIETDKFSNDIPELFKLNLPLDPNFDLFNGEEYYFPPNVNGAILFASTDKNRIITADYYSDRLNIYDLEMNLLEQKNGPAKIEPEYFTPDGRKISFANGLYWRSFYPSAFNSDCIYLLYVGINGINSSSTPIDKNPVEIWRIDWNGNLLERIKTDVFLTNISIDQNAKAIYGTTWNSSGAPPKLIRLNLDVND